MLVAIELGHYGVIYSLLHIWNVDLTENTLFKSYGVICLSLPSSTVPGQAHDEQKGSL